MLLNQERKLTILYGSQTGNAQDISERLWRESKRYYFNTSVLAMDDYNILNLVNENCVIFVCSTTGQGEEPDNMRTFWKFLLRKNLPSNSLSGVKCAVLGLGDSSYVKFNFVAKRLNKRLQQLGADIVLPVALGDDQHDLGYDAVVDVWIDSVWKKLLEVYPLPDDIQPLDANTTIFARWKMIEKSTENIDTKSVYAYKLPDNHFMVEVKENLRITSESHFQDVRLIKFKTHGETYEPGDVLNIHPKNSKDAIDDFYDVLKINGVKFNSNQLIKIMENSEVPVPAYLNQDLTFQALCEDYFDLTAIPRRYVFSVLAQLTSSDIEREKCIEFTTAEGQTDLYNYCNRPKRNITEVLRDFPHAVENLSLDMLFEIFSPIKHRSFSIASSSKAHENEIHLLVAVVKYKTKLVKERLGLCSNWLAGLEPGDKVPIWIKKGSFRFPKEQDVPILMVGPGTGVAPFRSYICESDKLNLASSKNLILFFGCRNEHHDFHCKSDFKRLENEEKLKLVCAFSRDQEDKVYVQHKIEEHADDVWNLLNNRNVHIFIAGNAKNMPQSVRESFITVCKKNNMSDEDAEKFITGLERNGKYQTETWS